MGNRRLLVSCPLILDSMTEYRETLAAHGIEYDSVSVDQQLDEDELVDLIVGYHAILAGDDELTETVLETADRLEVIVKWGIGTDNIDEVAARKRGIEVYNTPDVFGAEVADVVIGYAIMLTRRLHHVDRDVRDGKWSTPRGVSLAGRTFGVIGVGDIGSAVARRAAAHEMTVLGNDVKPVPDDLRQDVEPVDQRTLLERSDVVSLNCTMTEETRHMIGAEELDLLGPEGYLINTARGSLIDQDALVVALEEGRIAGAALDVFEREPLPASSPLTTMENVVLGSHNAQNTREAVERVNRLAIETVVDALTEE